MLPDRLILRVPKHPGAKLTRLLSLPHSPIRHAGQIVVNEGNKSCEIVMGVKYQRAHDRVGLEPALRCALARGIVGTPIPGGVQQCTESLLVWLQFPVLLIED